MEIKIIQITAGRGPVECCRVVAKVLEMMLKSAKKAEIEAIVLDTKKADIHGTLLSALLQITGENLLPFLQEWQGTIQWIAQSPYRKYHKRKNWFVGVEVFDAKKWGEWDEKEVVFETCRASGPGGQNVNKVETAVRGTHIPSQIQVMAMDSRSQLQNKKLCIERLKTKVLAWKTQQMIAQQQSQWEEHSALERGNAVKIIKEHL